MTSRLLSVFLIMIGFNGLSQSDYLITYYEKSGCKATPTYDETVAYCQLLDQVSEMIHYTTFGKSPQGRDLPLLIIDADGYTSPEQAEQAGKFILLIEAGIHSGEIDGKDAGLMFFRDLAIKKQFGDIPDNITFLFIPIFSVDGHERSGPYNRINQDGPEEMGWRTTAQNLNLNRDFLKADAPEMQAWLRLYQRWQPDFLVDIHVTDGADYQYVMTYGLETFGNLEAGLTNWTVDQFIPAMDNFMDKAGYPAHPYVMFRRWHDPRSGLRSSVAGPRFSVGYAAAQNRIGLLVENHSLKDYKTRVTGTYELLKFLNKFLSEHAATIKKLNADADIYTGSEDFRSQPFPVNYKAGPDSILVDFRGVEYDVVTSDLTGGDWFIYHPDRPATFRVPYFNRQIASATVQIPEAYAVPAEWTEMIGKLALHGIQYTIVEHPVTIRVESYRFTKVEYGKSTYEGRLQVTPVFEPITEDREFPAGSAVIPTNQRTAKILVHMFEPASPDSYLQWGYFNAIFELKEYFETYIMEEYARNMLAEEPGLREEFEKWKADNPEAARSQWSQLEWFYFRSPWVDAKRNVYPVGRILNQSILDELIKN
ncbi:MAG: M14 family metallopeptidase [Bacteroidales bacterium]|nr:M14 family metallopeptidase [Bacteroidales bacterium]